MKILIYIAATLVGLLLSYVGVVFAMLSGKQFTYVIGGLLAAAHIGTFLFVRRKAIQGKGREYAFVLVTPLFLVGAAALIFALGTYALLQAWPDSPLFNDVVKWREEVMFSTGEIIVVERETRFRRANSGIADLMTMRFRYPPDTKDVIEWQTVRSSGTGRGNYRPSEIPLVLDIEQGAGNIYLITLAHGTSSGCDEYWRYRYDNGKWKDDMLPEVFEVRSPNLFLDFEKPAMPNHINLDMNRNSGERKNIRYRKVGPDRCLCGHIGNPVKSGCIQKYKST